MNAGTLTDLIEIYRKTSARNDFGEKTIVYEPIGKVRANVEHGLGSRTTENDEIWHNYTKTFKVRLNTDIKDEDRILYLGHYYVVQSIDTDKHQQTITILTELINE